MLNFIRCKRYKIWSFECTKLSSKIFSCL